MTRQRVLEDAISTTIAYATGFGFLLLWTGRKTVDPFIVLFAGVAILIVVGVSVDWVAFRRPPSLGLSRRPWRYSIPQLVGFVAATTYLNILRINQDPDWGLIAYAVCIPLVFAGMPASNFWWAHATRPPPGDIPGRQE